MRLRSGVSAAAGRANLQRIANAANKVFAADPNAAGNNVAVLGVQRPAQIVNYRSIGSTPVILAVGLAVGAIVALALTLVASVRHRRRDLALLKALGFTPRQLAAVVAWQSTVTARRRRHRRRAARDRHRAPTLDAVRPQHQRGARPHRAGLVGGPRRRRCSRLRQPRGGTPRADRGTHPDGFGAARRVRPIARQQQVPDSTLVSEGGLATESPTPRDSGK